MSKTATIATKVTRETLAALELMATRRGTSVYELVLSAIVMLLRMGSKKQALSPRVMQSWHAFEQMYGSLSVANLSTLKQHDLDIQDAIYRVTQKGKKDATLIYMARPFFNEVKANQNNEYIVDMVLSTAYPSTHKMLKEIQEAEGLNSTMGVISHLIHTHYGELMERQIDELFSDNARAENTRDINNQRPYRRKNNKSVNQMQTIINFDTDEQGQELSQTDGECQMGATFDEDEGV